MWKSVAFETASFNETVLLLVVESVGCVVGGGCFGWGVSVVVVVGDVTVEVVVVGVFVVDGAQTDFFLLSAPPKCVFQSCWSTFQIYTTNSNFLLSS